MTDAAFGSLGTQIVADNPGPLVLGKPASTVAGDYLVAAINVSALGTAQDATITAPAGWTLLAGVNDTGTPSIRLNLYGRVAGGSEPATYTWSWTAPSGGNGAGFIQRFTSADGTTPVVTGEVVALGQVASTTSRPTASVTTAGSRLIMCYWADRNGSTWTLPGGSTARGLARSGSYISITSAEIGVVAAGTNSYTATASAATSVAASVILAIQGALPVYSHTHVDAWLAVEPFYCAHRCGGGNWPALSVYAAQKSVAWGAKAIEISCWQTTDGVFVASHDHTTVDMTGETYIIYNETWATLQHLMLLPANTDDLGQASRPIARIQDIVNAVPSNTVILMDFKSVTGKSTYNGAEQAGLTAILNYMDANGGPDRFMWKTFKAGYPSAQQAAVRGYRSWGIY